MDEMYLEDPIERLKLALFIVATAFFSIVICVGVIAWIFTGDFDILFRTLVILVLAFLGTTYYVHQKTAFYSPLPPDSFHPDMDARTDDEH